MKNVVTEIVKNGLCSGCGICAGIVNDNCLKMDFNRFGELVPVVSNCNNCGVCLSVCPFADSTTDSFSPSPLGKYMENYVGYSIVEEERVKGSSGGLATRVLRALLERRMVDGVVVVGSSKREGRFFEPAIVRTPEELTDYAGSKYYPIEFSSILKTLEKEVGQYAIIGLPCVIRALRLVQHNYPLIGRKIKYLLGLTCGHNKNKNYASFLLRLTESKEEDISTVQFRCKENTNMASNYGFKGILKNGRDTEQLNFSDSLVGKLWCNYFFSISACFYCEDLFAEQADISFMDAWLKPYINDSKGTSILIVRNAKLKRLLEDEIRSGHILLNPSSEKDVIKSQKGALDFKRKGIDKKRDFLLNKWLSNKFYSERGYTKAVGMNVLKIYILTSQKYKRIKEVLLHLINRWRAI